MPDLPFVFISSTTRDLEEERKLVAHWVNQHGCHAVLQNIFAGEPDTTTIPALLDKHLKPCAAIIHLCGFYRGSGPRDASPPISYTRLEYQYGKDHGLPVMVLLADQAKFLPLCPDQTEENAKEQRGYYDGFRNSPGLYYPFKEIRELEGTVTSFLKNHGIGTETPAPPHNLPFSSIGEKFVGREKVMEDLAQALEKGTGAAALTSVAAVHALGGLGKTRVAIEHAWHSRDRYTALLFVKAANALLPAEGSTPAAAVDPLMGPVASLSNVLKLGIEATEEAAHYRAVLDWFQNHKNWLLIIDNVDTKESQMAVNALLPRLANGHVLITSRLSTWSGAVRPLEIGTLPDSDGADLILRVVGHRTAFQDSREAATTISRELGGHALALQQAAAYILRSRISLEKYLEKWKTQRDELLNTTGRLHDYSLTVSATLEISFTELSPGARFLLDALSFFASDPIPRYVVESIILPDEANTAECLLELFDWHMAECGEGGDTVTVHGLVQILIREKLEGFGESEAPLQAARGAMRKASAELDPQDVRIWPLLEPLVPHLLRMADQGERTTAASISEEFLTIVGMLLHSKGRYDEAEPLYQRALEIAEEVFGKDHPNVVMELSNIASLLYETNRPAEAEPLFCRTIEICQRSFGESDPSVATGLSNLACLFRHTNRLAEAESLYRRALQIYEQSYEKDHPTVASGLSNLASLLQATNRFREAEPLFRRALEINEVIFGEHPRTAIRLNDLAGLLQDTNRLQDAEPLLRRALEICESSYGEDHPDVAFGLNNLADLLHETNRLHDAEHLYRRSLEIAERFFGMNHPKVGTVLNNLAVILRHTNRYQEAEQQFRRALEISECSFDKDHPRVATNLNNLAGLLSKTNRLQDAEPLLRRALDINERSFGSNHPQVALGLNNLAGLLQETDRLQEAESLSRKHLKILILFCRETGHQHPHLYDAANNYSSILSDLGLDLERIKDRINRLLAGEEVEDLP